MGRVVVVTAVHGPSAPHLPDAWKSLQDQELPRGWEWQWIVQEDGKSDDVAPRVPRDDRVSFGQGRSGGPGVARTLALSRVGQDVDLVRVLDADDMLTPGALSRDVRVLTSRPHLGWTTARVLDLLPDGSTVGFDQDPPEGVVERGAVLEHWQAHDYRAQVHPATLCVRRELLTALGGWAALPASEDTGLLLALNAVAEGWFHGEAGLLYRKWPGQATSRPQHAEAVERDARMAVVEARAKALGRMRWQYPGSE
ncbi:glycosyltransferase family A protein [Streptomyces reniochalinae]|uniref:Glycosyltransferase family 2 protein n=1 Tax=Streptomyces reniochalinae TaxID=2250578 RepID=A0A367EA63_9ACTN|nr:glycosyltransferase family A protein [Streptomyces reniochalinae]RCG14130.1 glycosyltransferase family 2 protein [Streptomyces reniochalinae]